MSFILKPVLLWYKANYFLKNNSMSLSVPDIWCGAHQLELPDQQTAVHLTSFLGLVCYRTMFEHLLLSPSLRSILPANIL